jgi:hypothetical protein
MTTCPCGVIGCTIKSRVPVEHGTHGVYTRHKCRCEICRAFIREYRAEQRKAGIPIDKPWLHGTENGYLNFGCRCTPCRNSRSATGVARAPRDPTVPTRRAARAANPRVPKVVVEKATRTSTTRVHQDHLRARQDERELERELARLERQHP